MVVLLPSAFVSKVNLIQAYALVSDEADVPASGFPDPVTQAAAGGEMRGAFGSRWVDVSKKLFKKLPSTDTTRKALLADLSNFASASEEKKTQLFKHFENQLVKHFESLLRQWHRDAQLVTKVKIGNIRFFQGLQYRLMIDLVGAVNRILPKGYHISFDDFFVKVFHNNELMQKIRLSEAPSTVAEAKANDKVKDKAAARLAQMLQKDFSGHFFM